MYYASGRFQSTQALKKALTPSQDVLSRGSHLLVVLVHVVHVPRVARDQVATAAGGHVHLPSQESQGDGGREPVGRCQACRVGCVRRKWY